MYAAHITASYHGQVIEDRVVLCEHPVNVGDGLDAVVAVPDVRIQVTSIRHGLCVDGKAITPHTPFLWSNERVEVTICAVRVAALEREPIWTTDIRFPLMMFALLLTMLSLQSVREVIVDHEDKLPTQLATWIASPNGIQELSTRSNPDFDLGEVGRFGVYRKGVAEPLVP